MRNVLTQITIATALLVATLFTGHVSAQTLTGTYSLPGIVNGTPVNNLTQLATLLNAGTVSGTAIFEFSSSYTGGETFPINFTQFGGTGSVIIRPSASVVTPLTIADSTNSNALINLSGVTHLTFDGRSGGTGSTINWQFKNTSVTGTYATFRFINGASYDTLKYLTVLASGNTGTGTILFSTTTSTGNSYNTVQNCTIGNYAGYPYNPILSIGTAGTVNANNTIKDNNIYNFRSSSNSSPFYAGINVTATGNGSNWTITGNSIYSSINPLTVTSTPIRAIYFNAGANSINNTISGNFIGGQQPLCGGAKWQVPAYGANGYADFDAIYFAGGASGNAISNNTIQNIWMASIYGSSTFRGINIIGGAVDVRNNVIGSATDTASIVSGLYGTMVGIHNQSTSAVVIDNNTIANFISDARSYVVNTSSTTAGATIGIFGYTSSAVVGANTITNNRIFNLSRKDNYNNNLYFPVNGGGGISSQNNIYQMNIVTGISLQTSGSGTQVISKNTVYNLYTTITGGGSNVYINGIVANTGSNASTTINGNLIYGLHTPNGFGSSNSTYTGLTGIYLPATSSTTYTVTNNIIQLGYRGTDGTSVTKSVISGIWDNGSVGNANIKFRIFHNSVYIGGSDNTAYNTYGFRRASSSTSSVYDSLTLRNNIFYNARTNSSTGKQYGMYWNSSNYVTSDYNDVLGAIYLSTAGVDYVTRALWLAAVSGYEASGLNADPQFVSAATTTPNLHINNTPASPVDAAGTATATLTYDFDSLTRSTYSPVDMGATVIGSTLPCTVDVTLTASQTTFCAGTSVKFTAHATNGGITPNFNFYRNGSSVQSGTDSTYTSTTISNNDSVWVILTSNAACAITPNDTSSRIKLTVTPSVTPAVALSASPLSGCQGTSITLTATATNGGPAPTYNFYRNGTSVQNGASNTYTSTSFNNSDSVWVVLTSNATCATTTTVTSTEEYLAITPTVVPTATITASQNGICQGTSVTFTATVTNGGASPQYNFFLNGASVQLGTLDTYTSSSLNNNDSVWVALTSNAACASPATVTSTHLKVSVTGTPVAPSVTLAATGYATGAAYDSICQGASVTFTAIPTNGGNAPTYTFYYQSAVAQTGSSNTYTNSQLTNLSQVYVILASNSACATQPTATSSTISIFIKPTPTSSTAKAICQGQSFEGHNTAGTFVDTFAAANGCDSIRTLTLTILPSVTTTINDTVCFGALSNGYAASGSYVDTFAAANTCDSIRTLNLIVLPQILTIETQTICAGTSYQGHTVAGTYSDTLTGARGCDSIHTLNLLVQAVILTNDTQAICSHSSYAGYTAAGTYIDTFQAIGGCDSVRTLVLSILPTYRDTVVQSGCFGDSTLRYNSSGTYLDTVTSINGCDTIHVLVLTVNPLPAIPSISQSNNVLTATHGTTYQWYFNGNPIVPASDSTLIVAQNGFYEVAITDSNGCSNISDRFNVTNVGIGEVTINPVVSIYPNPTAGALSIVLSNVNATEPIDIRLYDALGQMVYHSILAGKGGNLTTQLQLGELAQGLLMLQINQGTWSINKRIVLAK